MVVFTMVKELGLTMLMGFYGEELGFYLHHEW